MIPVKIQACSRGLLLRVLHVAVEVALLERQALAAANSQAEQRHKCNQQQFHTC